MALTRNEERTQAGESVVLSKRGDNQAVVYLSIFMPALLSAADNDSNIKAELDQLQLERDRLRRFQAAKQC